MSGARRDCANTLGSIFLAAAKDAPLSRTADSALRPISKTGTAACDNEYGIGFLSFIENAGDHMHATGRRFKFPRRGAASLALRAPALPAGTSGHVTADSAV